MELLHWTVSTWNESVAKKQGELRVCDRKNTNCIVMDIVVYVTFSIHGLWSKDEVEFTQNHIFETQDQFSFA